MSELIRTLPDSQLNEILAEAKDNHLDDVEELINHELSRRLLAFTALSYGVYDADDETPNSVEHPQDNLWNTDIRDKA